MDVLMSLAVIRGQHASQLQQWLCINSRAWSCVTICRFCGSLCSSSGTATPAIKHMGSDESVISQIFTSPNHRPLQGVRLHSKIKDEVQPIKWVDQNYPWPWHAMAEAPGLTTSGFPPPFGLKSSATRHSGNQAPGCRVAAMRAALEEFTSPTWLRSGIDTC